MGETYEGPLMADMADPDAALKRDLRRVFTDRFLDCCKKYGITEVCIEETHRSVPTSIQWSKQGGFTGHVFTNYVEYNGSPAIWQVCEEMEIAGSCGNVNEHSILRGKLIPGVYHYKKEWVRIDDLEAIG